MKKVLKKVFRAEYVLFYILILIFVFFCIVCGSSFYSSLNITNILQSAGPLAIMLYGVTWVVGAGKTDVAFPEVGSLTSMTFAYFYIAGTSSVLAGLFGIGVGLAMGAVSAFLIIKCKFHPLISTIAVSTAGGALAISFSGGSAIKLSAIASKTFIYDICQYQIGPFPMIFIISVAIALIMWFVQEKTKFGQYIYAIGDNPQAVKEAGVATWKIDLILYMVSAFCAAFAGLVYTITVYTSGQPIMGTSFFLNGFTIVFLGALAIKLGKCNVLGTLISAVILSCMTNGLTQLGAHYSVTQLSKGILLLIGVGVVTFTRRKRIGKAGILKYE
jgi:ribose transport system permease protein